MSAEFDEALGWLLSFSDPKRGVGWNPANKSSLDWNVRRMRVLLDIVGAPDRRMACVLVAGTKGKGSTSAMIAALLARSGTRVGLATKPQLQSYRERVRVDGRAISEQDFVAQRSLLGPAVERLARTLPQAPTTTTFELLTALALTHFARAGCEVTVIEVGLGGRFDATNACDPHVSVITAISHDHTRELGPSLRGIATEKAGVVRPGRVAIIAPQTLAARRAILAECRRAGAQPHQTRPISTARARQLGLELHGVHQRANAACALAACESLAQHGVTYRERVGALAGLAWPGRFEVLRGTPPIVLDIAHNDGSAAALASTLRAEYPRRRITLVLGLMADKDARAVLRPLVPLASRVEATQPRGPRALEASRLARLIRTAPVRAHPNVSTAIVAARAGAGPRDVICVTGSSALVGEARDALGVAVVEQLWP